MIIREATLPLRLVTLENQREHWAVKAKRAQVQRFAACHILCTRRAPEKLQKYVVTLTRVGPRRLDSGNFQGCFKHVQDGVADWLGIDDGDARIEWRYEQKRGKPREYACVIRIERKEVAA